LEGEEIFKKSEELFNLLDDMPYKSMTKCNVVLKDRAVLTPALLTQLPTEISFKYPCTLGDIPKKIEKKESPQAHSSRELRDGP
jgi:hypothetical protein